MINAVVSLLTILGSKSSEGNKLSLNFPFVKCSFIFSFKSKTSLVFTAKKVSSQILGLPEFFKPVASISKYTIVLNSGMSICT